ncbi:MAG: PKD domain-containing protein, partial [Bacteroidota bacterium]
MILNSYATIQWVPDEPLEENMTYTLSVTSGLQDCVGNGANPYSFTFSTGGSLNCGEIVAVNSPPIITSFEASSDRLLTGETLTFEALVSDADGDDLEYRWSFDDGNVTEWGSNATESHRYSSPGNYQVILEARDDEDISKSFANVAVSNNAITGSSANSSPIILDDVNRTVWVVNPDNNSFTSISADELTVQNEYAVGEDPTGIVLGNDGNLWITCRDADQVWVINPDDGSEIERIDMGRGSRPYAIIQDPNDDFIYVSEMGSGEVSRISTATRAVDRTVSVGPTPRAMAIDAISTTLYVSRMISGPDGGEIYRVDLSDFSTASSLGLSVDDTSPPESGVNGPGIPNYVSGVAINPNGNELTYTSKKDNIFNGTSTIRNGFEFTFERTVRSIIGKVDLQISFENTGDRVDIDDMAQPSSVVYSENGNFLIVTMQGNNLVIVLDAFSGSELSRSVTGLAPQGVLIDPATDRVFTKDFMDRTVTVFDGSTVFGGTAGPMEELAKLSTVQMEVLSSDVLRGKQIFYNSDDTRMTQQGDNDNGYITCATCHIDGTHDGIVWDFTQRGEGLRNTTSLIGRAGTGHGRVHWTANFDEIQDFEHDMRDAFGGQGFMSDAEFNSGTRNTPLGDTKEGISNDLDALAAYLESLDRFDPSPYKPSDTDFSTEGLLGREIFERLECASCHSGGEFTNSTQGYLADVGTITGTSGGRLSGTLIALDVPTLKDVWSTAPYLHDGSAETLHAVFDSHIGTESLSSTELDQLVSYLLEIDDSETSRGTSSTVSIETPEVDSEIEQGSPITFSVNSSFNSSDISQVIYYANGMEVVSTAQAPYTANWTPTELGSYDLQAKVILSNGLALASSDIVHTVTLVEDVLSAGLNSPKIQIYPNPFTDELSVEIEQEDAVLQVFDVGG